MKFRCVTCDRKTREDQEFWLAYGEGYKGDLWIDMEDEYKGDLCRVCKQCKIVSLLMSIDSCIELQQLFVDFSKANSYMSQSKRQ